jgi:hypothetical protein
LEAAMALLCLTRRVVRQDVTALLHGIITVQQASSSNVQILRVGIA